MFKKILMGQKHARIIHFCESHLMAIIRLKDFTVDMPLLTISIIYENNQISVIQDHNIAFTCWLNTLFSEYTYTLSRVLSFINLAISKSPKCFETGSRIFQINLLK